MTKTEKNSRKNYHIGNLPDRLLAATREEIESSGADKLSLRSVAQRVGVSAPAAYHHFANRRDLLAGLAIIGFSELRLVLQKTVTNGHTTESPINAGRAYVDFARNNPELYQLMFGAEFGDRAEYPRLQEAAEQSHQILKEIFANVLQVPVDNAAVGKAAFSAWSLAHGLSSLLIQGVIRQRPGQDIDNLIDDALQGLPELGAL